MARMPERVAQKGALAMIERGGFQHLIDGVELSRFAVDIFAQGLHRSFNNAQLVKNKIGQIIVVGLGVQKGSVIPRGDFAKNLGNGQKFKRRVPIVQHRPVEEGVCCAAIAIDKRVVVTQPKMQRSGVWGFFTVASYVEMFILISY